jgi:hypothetical protein
VRNTTRVQLGDSVHDLATQQPFDVVRLTQVP